jgi:hypothetical protein
MTSLSALADALAQAESERLDLLYQRRVLAREARAAGVPVTAIAAALRISRQQAHTLLTD